MKNAKAMQALQMEKFKPTKDQKIWTPEGLDTPESWEDKITSIYTDESYGGLFQRYLLLPNAANIPRRGVIYAGAIALSGREGSLKILDVGCSTNKSLVALATPGLSLGDIEVVDPIVNGKHSSFEVNDENSEVLNNLIRNNGVRVGPSLGIDIRDWLSDPFLANYVRSNSFYMEELFDERLIAQFDRLGKLRPRNVGFQVLDITVDYSDKEAMERAEAKDPEFDETFDVVYLSTMLYQLKKNERATALANAHKWVKPDGLIIVQDFVDFLPMGKTKFYNQAQWRWKYNVWVKDMQMKQKKFRKYFNIESGRAERLVVQPIVGKLAVAQEIGLKPPRLY